MWGIIPAAGRGSRIQPLAFSKELLPVGSRRDGGRRAALRGQRISGRAHDPRRRRQARFRHRPGKSDILELLRRRLRAAPRRLSWCSRRPPGSATRSSAPRRLLDDEPVLVGLPDTIWFPQGRFSAASGRSAFFPACFPVERPELFDAVLLRRAGRVHAIEVKRPGDTSRWIWGAFKMPCSVFHALHGSGRSETGATNISGPWSTPISRRAARRGRAGRRLLCGRRNARRLPRRDANARSTLTA